MRFTWRIVGLVAFFSATAHAHNIPNARVDRSIQVTVRPERLEVDYEVSLSELTLTRDLRDLIGTLPGAEPKEWYERYGQETGPLNARGILASVDGRPLDLECRGFDVTVEEHPRYTFHLDATLPARGKLVVQDTNYVASEGTSRLAVRGRDGITIRGDDLPSEVALIPNRPVWQLTDQEERRTKQVEVDFDRPRTPPRTSPAAATPPKASKPAPTVSTPSKRLSSLLDRASRASIAGLLVVAFGLGMAHAIQPGHGKSLVAAAVVGRRGRWTRGTLLAFVATLTHTGSVLLVAAGLWLTRSARYGAIDHALAQVAGFAIAAIGLWRLGRHLGGYGEHGPDEQTASDPSIRGLIGLGVAAGLVPCWDAVALIVLAEAVGRLALGLALLVAFSLGMALILVIVGLLAAQFRRVLQDRRGVDWERVVGIGSSVLLAMIGITLMALS